MRVTTAFHTVCNVTHNLLVIAKDVMRLSFTKCALNDASLPVGNRKRYNETAFQKMCNVTHKLLVMSDEVTAFHKSLTFCW